MAARNGIRMPTKLVTPDDADTFALMDAEDIRGGLHSVADAAALAALPATKQRLGMQVYIQSTGQVYALRAMSPASWLELRRSTVLRRDSVTLENETAFDVIDVSALPLKRLQASFVSSDGAHRLRWSIMTGPLTGEESDQPPTDIVRFTDEAIGGVSHVAGAGPVLQIIQSTGDDVTGDLVVWEG
ncbi:hypothetical protein [Parvularcula sp. LCG005]|uniref:hypothetical protein n=1 Tax=Parvularcula sp. LCG005 TaxID=3078805 RepID=UPI0029434B93|nr:hypothetical protein [Parvularcula sp. LCG005]WOI54294.1 hypothetical protein RUI03_04660 [Parvularcula sp. LCG005]